MPAHLLVFTDKPHVTLQYEKKFQPTTSPTDEETQSNKQRSYIHQYKEKYCFYSVFVYKT